MKDNPALNMVSDGPKESATAAHRPVNHPVANRMLLVLGLGAVCLSVVALVFVLVVWPQLDAIYHWREAHRDAEAGRFLEAREHLRRCLEVWPASGETHFQMARICRRAGDYATAQHHLQQARQYRWPGAAVDLELLLLDVQANGARGPDAATLQHFIYSNQHPDEKLILEALVKGYVHNFYLRDAEYWLNYWVEMHPDDWFAYYWRGQLRERFGKLDEAIADYRQALRLSPGQLDAAFRLGQVLQQKGIDLAEARQLFELYLKAHPEDGPALLGLARCHRGLGEPASAQAVLDRIKSDSPSYAKALLLRALLASDQENYPQALEYLREAERLNPKEPDIAHQLAHVLNQLGRPEEARPYAERHKQLEAELRELGDITRELLGTPADVEKRYRAGVILLRAGQEEGVRWLLTVLREDPNHRPTHEALAEFYSKSSVPEHRRLAELHRRRVRELSEARPSGTPRSP
ncbi:MAG: tetratricopeptide repeat protein [Gemmatales bacterium]|nr:tetratricopeptide repeat protein [Gemmatales bacterium]MDW8386201.1 tetratricopeptide repeat protein [Gemmatales bacterium]